jgi:hypothetical protein
LWKAEFYVSAVEQNSPMFTGPLGYEFYLLRFADIYFLIGKLEITLRLKLPVALRNYAIENNYSEWLDVVPRTPANQRTLAAALENNSQRVIGLEDYLPLSFWSHLFHRDYYSVLWTPCLHTVFVGIGDSMSWGTFLKVSKNLRRATRIRNRVAHFNLVNAGDHEEEVATLKWLINGMGVQLG